MRVIITKVIATLMAVAVLVIGAAYATETPPPPDKMKKLKFPDFKEFRTENGMDVLVVEHREQPVVTIYVTFKLGSSADPIGKEGLAAFTIELLNKGTETRDALTLADWIESVGGSVGTFLEQDFAAITVTVLSDYIDTAYEYLQDVIMNPIFPDDELELTRKQTKTGLEFELSSPEAMARRHLRNLVYGEHPYAKQPTLESVESITRDDVMDFYTNNLVANNVLVAVVGDVKSKNVKKAMEKYFETWQPGEPANVAYQGAPEAGPTKVYLYHKPNAVQTEIFVGHLAPTAQSPDWPAMVVGNRVLGGGSDARLFANIREEKGWTYRVNSRFSRQKDLGTFVARTPVRTEVTDSALVELMSEIKRITEEPVTADELKNAKNYLIGNFPISIETPNQIARQVGQYKLLGLDKKDLETYRDRIAAVTIEDVGRVMKEYVHPDRAYIVLVGDATQIHEKVAPVATVEMFDIAGVPMTLESMTVEGVSYTYDTSLIEDMKATYSLTVQQMAIGDMNVSLEKKNSGGKDVIEVSSNLAGMITFDETVTFSAKDFSPISIKSSMQMGPRSAGSDLAFTETGGTGTVQDMESPEPKEVTFELVEGTILDNTLEYAIGCLPLEVSKTYRFPVVETQSGTLQNVDVEILEIVDVETAAGTFSAFKIKVKRPNGDAYMYLGTDSPHIMVKQEVPSQAMNIELKSIESKSKL